MAFTLGNFILAALFLAVVAIGMATLANDVGEDSNLEINLTGLDRSAQLTEQIAEIKNTSSTKLTDIPIIGGAFSAVEGAVQFLDFVGDVLYETWDDLINNLGALLSIPSEQLAILVLIIIVVILLLAVSGIIKWRLI